MVLAGKGIAAVANPVGPGHQQLTTSGRAAGVLRVSSQDVTPSTTTASWSPCRMVHCSPLGLTLTSGRYLRTAQFLDPTPEPAGVDMIVMATLSEARARTKACPPLTGAAIMELVAAMRP